MSRAAQKLNIKSHKKKKHHEEKEEKPQFPTNFSDVIRMNPPPAPPALVRSSGRLQNPSTGKVKVMLRICPVESSHSETFLSIDQWKKQVTLYDPAQSGYTTAAHRKPGVTPPKMFAFDAVFSQDDSMPEICANSLVDIIQAVVNGADGCLFCYGHARLGKTYTMIGVDDSPQNLGILPCSIAWLFKLINDQKDQTGARFSVRVSAVEVTGKQEQLKDLLADVASGNESGGNTAPGVYLREDPICGTQLENQSELRAPTAERAAYYLDAAIAARTIPEAEEDARNSHLLFTLHVYQYRVEKNSKGQATGKEQQVAGGRSRLHLIDLGSCSKSTKDGNALSLSALGTVIMALLNGQRHVPHRDSKLTQLMRESLGSLSCRTCMIAHVSPSMQAYNETLQVTQLAAKIHRMKRRKTKFSSTSSDDSSSCSESGPFRPRMRVGVRMGTYGAYSDPDYTSSSEQSCDTVIYVGPGGQALSDRELTDNEGPPSVVPIVPRTRSLPRPSKLASQEYQYPLSEEGEMSGEIPVKQPKTMPKCGATTVASSRQTSKSGSPSRQLQAQQGQPVGAVGGSGIVQLPRKINVSKTKVLQHARMNMEQQDSYNPSWSYREGPAGEAAPGGEQWVDGPGAPHTSAPHEQWIDGPNIAPVQQSWSNESYVYNGEGKPIPLSSVSSSGLVKPSAEEQWVDGPREFQGEEKRRSHGSPHKMTKAEKAHKMWKQMSGKPLPPQRVSSLENWTPQYKSQVPHRDDREHYREQSRERHRDRRPRDLEQPKSGQLRNPHVHHLSTNESRPSSHGSGGESASSSMVAQTSRPSVDMETDQSHKDVGPKADDSLPNAPVKSFVRDWVEKHSVGPTESPEQSQHGSPSKHTSSRHHKSKEVKNPTISDMLYEKENTIGGSAHSSPRSSRKHHHKLKKTALPPSDSTQSRITQWVQQVQEATSTSTEAPFSPNSEAPISEELLAPECDQAMLFDIKSPAPPPYEACVGSDAGIDDLDEDIPDVELQYLDAEKARLESQTSTEVIKDSRDSDHKPLLITEAVDKEAFNKGLDEVEKSSTISKSSDAKILKEKESNSEVTKDPDEAERHQDSLYEMDIDTQFEEIEKDSKLNSTFTSEDDAGSNAASLPKKDIDKVLADSPLTVDVHQQALQVSRTSDEGVAEETCETNDQVTAELIVHAQLSPLSVNADVDSGNASAHSGEHLSPPSSSDDSDKVTTRGRSLCRPSCLRRPDGASNPNLSIMEQTLKEKAETVGQEKDAVVGSHSSVLPKPLYSSAPSATSKVCHVTAGEISPIPKRSVLGHSPEDSSRGEQAESPGKLSKLPLKSPSKDTKVQIKDSKEKSKSKPSILPKPLSRKSKSADRAESTSSSPSKLIPSRFSSKSSTSSKSSKSSAGSASPTKSSSSSRKSEKHSGKHAKSSSPSPSSRPSSVKSAPSRFSSPFFSRLPTSSPSKSSKTQITSPSKSSTSSSNGGKESRSKIKSPSSSKKESKLPVSKTATSPTGKVPGLPPPRPSGRGTDSDSGNDSGIVKNDKSKRLLSPYSTVTNPRVSTHSSSGHGSDFSTSSAQQVLEKNTKLLRQKEAHLSSGYESMVGQDGEATGTSSGTQDSTSESSAGGRIHGNKVLKKKPPSCAGLKSRSRSAPPPKVDSPASVHKDSPVQSPSHNPASPSSRHAWVDTRHAGYDATDETMEIQFYDVDDVERIHKRRKEAAEMQVTEKRKERIQQLLQRQEELKMELAEAKGRLMINKSTWSFDLHVAEQTNWEDPSHLEALEKETSILEKRVDACKARIMMVTCFDANLA